jgi:hypothetical protein
MPKTKYIGFAYLTEHEPCRMIPIRANLEMAHHELHGWLREGHKKETERQKITGNYRQESFRLEIPSMVSGNERKYEGRFRRKRTLDEKHPHVDYVLGQIRQNGFRLGFFLLVRKKRAELLESPENELLEYARRHPPRL